MYIVRNIKIKVKVKKNENEYSIKQFNKIFSNIR
jgi:hypothetical protein